jgi:8-oxo-dGTP pyrophosphatase MutT (NUDIX family)
VEPRRALCFRAGMIRRILFFGLLTVGVAAAEPSFWRQLTPEQRKAAGIDQLTPAQQAALDAAAAQFAREGARREVEVAQAQAQTEKLAAVRQAKEEARIEVKAERKRQAVANAGFAVREDDEAIRTRIIGDFRGWTGKTVFTLENGQVWQQTDKEDRAFPKLVNPEVELTPHRLFGWKMTLVAEGLGIRVKRVK